MTREQQQRNKIKICGLKRPEDITYVNEAKPDYCGFIIEFPKSSRNVTGALVRELTAKLNPDIIPVGVFVNAAPERVEELLLDGTIHIAQLHGQEDEAYIRRIQKNTGHQVIKAFSVKTAQDIENALKSPADYILLDQGGGGTGQTFDWSLIPEIDRPFFLAGGLGVENLNKILQRFVNPQEMGKKEREFHGVLFREQDKIMQIKNDYQMKWKKVTRFGDVYEEGTGVFNGDVGIIQRIYETEEVVEVEFEEGKMVEYDFSQMDEMELAYAITIHKSQGSEYPAVVIPILGGPRMLMNRNLLYTAVTRAKKCVTLVGSKETVYQMIGNVHEQKRYSGLCQRIHDRMLEEQGEC